MTRAFRYLIGIDLGTTQCAASYYDLNAKDPRITLFNIPQLTQKGQVDFRAGLPSVLFFPEEGAKIQAPDWMKPSNPVAGLFALELGSQVPGRLVQSSKSWLCNPRVDRSSAFLPWQSDLVTEKLSPVGAARLLLQHIISAWDHHFASDDPAAKFSRQKVVVTVPASFDPVARNLTVEAIEGAGIKNFTLLEEPLAAFHEFLHRREDSVDKLFNDVKTALVVDIGGGTTDFSLVAVEHEKGSKTPSFKRQAVGPHLLVGGDNLDLAVARKVEAIFRHRGKKLVTRQWLALLHQSRSAKEKALGGHQGKIRFQLPGAGSSVIAGTLAESVDAAELREFLLDGFFPIVESDCEIEETGSTGISEAGLPFTKEPAVTKHLARFLREQAATPDAILFNGGTLCSSLLRERLQRQLSHWLNREITVLENPQPEFAVSVGATSFAMASQGLGIAVEAGAPISIYLGIGATASSKPGNHVPKQLVCLMPRGTKADSEITLSEQTFGLDLSQKSAFYLYTSSTPPKKEKPGKTTRYLGSRFDPLPPLTFNPGSNDKGIKTVELRVKLAGTGCLQLFCHGVEDDFLSSLSFDLSVVKAPSEEADKEQKDASGPGKRTITAIEKLFSKALKPPVEKQELNGLFKELETLVGSRRQDWGPELLRPLHDMVIDDKRFRQTPDTFCALFRLAGFSLRPGYGATGDEDRVELLVEQFEKFDPGPSNPELACEKWIMLRRIAPGLDEERQLRLCQMALEFLFPSKKPALGFQKPSQHERNQLWRMIGHLERVPVEEKSRIGNQLLRHPATYSTDGIALYALGRLGTRTPSYACATTIIEQKTVETWVSTLLRHVSSGGSYLEWSLRELARKTGDRLTEVNGELRRQVIDLLTARHRKKSFMAPLLQVCSLKEEDFAEYCGESLPPGILWVQDRTSC